ncbi:MAG: PIN domain-containing protein [Spirochaetaceae bacterium]|jgi:predicted nucleic acid-binding protein|nr:PIN domain-containing protein [Spirochaetaceae bacterium]
MKTILIDLNIILDYLNKREGHEKALEIIIQCCLKKVKGFICAHEITTLSYFLESESKDKNKNIKTISGILKMFEIIEINKTLLEKALLLNINDYEDAVIVASASEEGINYIITKNIKDFKNSQIKVLLPEEFLAIK